MIIIMMVVTILPVYYSHDEWILVDHDVVQVEILVEHADLDHFRNHVLKDEHQLTLWEPFRHGLAGKHLSQSHLHSLAHDYL